jgi:deoxyribodipyrimidine photolyase
MKTQDLFEEPQFNPASSVDIKKSLDNISAGEEQVDALKDKYQQKKDKPLIKSADTIMSLVREFHTDVWPEFDKIKQRLDAAYRAKNWDAFAKTTEQLKGYIYEKNISKMMNQATKRTRMFKVVTPFKEKLVERLQFILQVRDSAVNIAKRKQNED